MSEINYKSLAISVARNIYAKTEIGNHYEFSEAGVKEIATEIMGQDSVKLVNIEFLCNHVLELFTDDNVEFRMVRGELVLFDLDFFVNEL
jgi:hypothetical protein